MKWQHELMRRRWQWALVAALMAVLFVGTGNAYAQSDFVMLNVTHDGGGGNSTGGTFSLGSTIGQPDAGHLAGGSFTLIGGFWTPLELGPTAQPDDFILNMPFLTREATEEQ